MRNARPSTNLLLQMVEDGLIDKDQLIINLVKWMSEADVREFVRVYELDKEPEYV